MPTHQKLIGLIAVAIFSVVLFAQPGSSAKSGEIRLNLVAKDSGKHTERNSESNFGIPTFQQTAIDSIGKGLVWKPQFEFGQNQFTFYKENNLYISSGEGESSLLGTDIKVKQYKNFITSKRYTYRAMPKGVLNNMKFSEGMGFYSALQSPDEKTWLFVERNMANTSYNLCSYNSENRTTEIIFSEDNSPDSTYAFVPIAWSSSKNVIYLEALVFGSATENEGIWSYDLGTRHFSKLSISSSYLTTPVISPDGEYLIYGGTTDLQKGLHSAMNIVFVYSIKNESERIVAQDSKSWFSISGWVDNNIEDSDLININEAEPSSGKGSANAPLQPSFELPWNSGVTYYVSRAGTPAPAGAIGSSCFSNIGFAPHTYIATDFDSPNGVYDPVRAAAGGTVIYAQFNSGGYGNLVKIRHDDQTISYYAHLNSISVSVNDVVQQGCEIGDGGTTGNSTGDHIHFEWRDANDVRMPTYPTFNECGCQPHANYCYTSSNSTGTCTGSTCLSGNATLKNRDNGPPIHPPGSVIKTASSSTVYLIDLDNRRRGITIPSVLAQLYSQSTDARSSTNFSSWVITVGQDELDLYEPGGNISSAQPGNGKPFPDGKLISYNGQVSIVTGGGKRRPFADGSRFTALGFNFCQVVDVSQSEYNSYPEGPPVDAMALLTANLNLSPAGPYSVGQNISGTFTIKNVGYASIPFSSLGIGGRFNGLPYDLGFETITLAAGSSRSFGSPSRQLTSAGTYDFFAAYQESNGHWAVSVPAAPGITRNRQITTSSCSYSLSPASQSFGSGSGSNNVSVTAGSSCAWTAVSNNSFITINAGNSGSGNGTVSYSVSTNSSSSQRTGTMTIAGQTFNITQSGSSCNYSLFPSSQSFGSVGESNNVSVTAGSGCAWTAVSNNSFITINAGSSGSGNGTVSYSVSTNSSSSQRTGTMTIAGQTFNVTQSGTSCSYSISPTSQTFSAGAGSGNVAVTGNTGCSWTAASNDSFITITSGSSGSGNGMVNYSVAANPSSGQRVGTMTIAGRIFTVTQSGGGDCASSTLFLDQTINGTLATSDCFFSGTTRYVDVYDFSGTSGQQVVVTMNSSVFDTFLYLLDSNNQLIAYDDDGGGGTNSRIPTASGFFTLPATGNYTVYATSYSSDGVTGSTGGYGITLSSASCSYALSPTSQNFASAGGNGSFSVSTSSGCAWTAVSNASWITTTSNGSGNGNVNYAVASNSGAARSGTLTLNGQTHTVNQDGAVQNVLVTVQTDPSGRSFTVDGTTYTSAQTFNWMNGASHSIATTSLQNGSTGTRYSWSNWSDAGAISHTVSPTSSTTYIANFTTQYLLTMNAGAGGTADPATGYFNSGQTVAISASANTGFSFSGWTGSGSGSFTGPTNSTNVAMNGPITETANFVQSAPRASCVLPGDFDGDGKADLAVWRPANGIWYINGSNGSQRMETWGAEGDIPLAADYDGDGKADLAVYRPSGGTWYVLNSFNSSTRIQSWGLADDVPVPGDYDADGKADIAIWRPASGQWFILNSSNGATGLQSWGAAGDVPVPGDYDGDHKTDLAVWRPLTGQWFILNSTNGSTRVQGWGAVGDVPASADYDGDGKVDIAVFRPSTGVWYIIKSLNNTQFIQSWGANGDIPVPSDYDGDAKRDVALWRPSNGTWYIVNSLNNSQRVQGWGLLGDTPVSGTLTIK